MGPSTLDELARAVGENAGVAAQTRTLDAREIRDRAASGASVLVPLHDAWVTISRSRCTLVDERRERDFAPTIRRIKSLVGNAPVDALILESRFPMAALSRRALGTASAWQRLRALLALERSEIAALVVFAVVLGGLSLAVPVAVQVLVNTIAFGSLLQPLVILVLLLFGVLAFSATVQVARWYAMEVLQRRIFVRVSEDFARRLSAASYEQRDEVELRELSNRFFDVVTIQKTASQLLLDGLGLALQTAVGMVLLGFYHPVLLAFDVALLIALGLVVLLGYGAVPTALAESQEKYRVAAWIQNLASQPGLFKRGSAATFAAQKADLLTRSYIGARRRHYRRVLRQLVGGMGVQMLALVSLLGLGGWLVMRGELTLGQLVAAELVVGAIGAGFAKIGKHLESAYDLLAGLDKVGMVLDLEVEDQPSSEPTSGEPLYVSVSELRLTRGSWASPEPISMEVDPGDRIWVTGPGGSGKSTLLETLAGLRTAQEGRLRIRHARSAWGPGLRLRKRAHLVRPGQTFAGSLLENLQALRPDLDEAEAWKLLEKVELCDVVRAHQEGIHTQLGESGAPLSRSELARFALACGLAASPDLLLLDGTVDDLGLDPERERQVLDVVFGPQVPWAVVVVGRHPELAPRCRKRVQLGATGKGEPSW